MWIIFKIGIGGTVRSIAYLAGSMEYSDDGGILWRREFESKLKPIGIDCIIPNDNEEKIIGYIDLKELKKTDIEDYKVKMRSLIINDIFIIEKVDLIIVKWEGELLYGTIGELTHAFICEKPSYLITSKDEYDVGGWFLACFKKVFKNIDDFINYTKTKNFKKDMEIKCLYS
jgi:hypothetical protein